MSRKYKGFASAVRARVHRSSGNDLTGMFVTLDSPRLMVLELAQNMHALHELPMNRPG